MTDREKLIELIKEARNKVHSICSGYPVCDDCPARKDGGDCHEGIVADHLIANGVTFVTDTNDGGKKTSKQKTKDILDWAQSTAEVDWGFMCCLKQELEQLVAIASRDDAFGDKWVPVTERLPKPDENPVLAVFYGCVNPAWFYGGAWELPSGLVTDNVTHWMPLPRPPKGADDHGKG